MAWLLSSRLPSDVIQIIQSFVYESQVLCRCKDCKAVLLIQDTEPIVRRGDLFTCCATYDAMEVAVSMRRRARLYPSNGPTDPERTLDLTMDGAVHSCERTPRWFRAQGLAFENSRPVMRMFWPFTRVGQHAVCVACRAQLKRLREGFVALRL